MIVRQQLLALYGKKAQSSKKITRGVENYNTSSLPYFFFKIIKKGCGN